jgi:hypothetical protein
LKETTDWMQKSLSAHNGQRLDSTLAKDVKVLALLNMNGCKLNYQVTNYETVQYDLSDIDPRTIKMEKIADAAWVVFRTRNYNHSVLYTHSADAHADYSDEGGGFSLDTEEHANSFANALHRAVDLCGGKPSTF